MKMSWRSGGRRSEQTDGRATTDLDRRIDDVLDELGVPDGAPGEDQLRELLRKGRKVQAIKAYREMTGAGLATAKDAVERMLG